ncbi:E3 ubiquitin-protein ligase sina-like [Cydia fagiglandana]|uniref:E3 ubiquitin-protein ligase sina-like n=1 Tax=Cydia fagiglandana TaxID=1458189 RepID=UPI002FEE412C
MGADSSKEENKSRLQDERLQRRNQYATQQRRQESLQTSSATHQSPVQTPTERSRTPYNYTTENLQSVIKQTSQPNVLERSRNPYNYNSEDLHGIKQTPNLYPNLNVSRGEDNFVYVNRPPPTPTRPSPQPSAPPASEVNEVLNIPTTALNASRSPSTPQASLLVPTTKHPFSQVNVVQKASVSHVSASPKVFVRTRPPPPYNSSHNAPGTSQSANASTNKNEALSDAKPNTAGPSKSKPSATKNGPKPGGRGRDNDISCPTCGQRYGLSIYQCSNGHGSCQDCRLAQRSCGKCLSPITAMRNIAMEAVIADLNTTCPNEGCTLRFNFDGMQRHLKECPFGEMDCPMGAVFGQCSTRCKVSDMATHFDECHKEQRSAEIHKEMYVFNICMDTHKMYLIKNGPYNFLVHVKVDEKERKISMTVQLLGTKISADKWTYEFHVYNKRQPLRKYLYVDNCQSIGTHVEDIFKDSQCATLPLSYAMTFVNESALTYKFYIKKEMNQRGRRRGPRNNDVN